MGGEPSEHFENKKLLYATNTSSLRDNTHEDMLFITQPESSSAILRNLGVVSSLPDEQAHSLDRWYNEPHV